MPETDLFGNPTQESAPADPAAGPFADVAIERGIDASPTGLTYRVPTHLDLRVGHRVVVPLGRGNKKATGYIVRIKPTTDLDPRKLKPIAELAPGAIELPEALVELARWVASYYVCPLGMVFGALLPAAVTRGTGATRRQMVRPPESKKGSDPFSKDGPASAGPDVSPAKPTKLQQHILDTATKQPGWTDIKVLADLAGAKSTASIKTLIKKGMLEAKTESVVVSNLDLRAQQSIEPERTIELGPGQRDALAALIDRRGRFGVHLLHGVTGSGKTEVYLRLIDSIRNDQPDSGAIVLVPEIALTPQTVGRFLTRFGPDTVAVLHSGLTAAQRHAQWRRIESGSARIVVGARSAVFAPLPNLQLIIVDEEHDSSYKQDQLPRYHARDVAIKRAQTADVPVVLGSATPSLESYANAVGFGGSDLGARESLSPDPQSPIPKSQTHTYLHLPDRVPGMRLPEVEIVDLVEERRHRRGIHLLSRRLEQRLTQTIDDQSQAMLLLNRRGYANYIACPDYRCGWMLTCEHCDATMVYHRDKNLPLGGLVRCHHCLAEAILPAQCPDSGHKVSVFGLGTQKVQAELEEKFPGARIARMDSDTMRRAEDYQRTLDQFRAGELDILLGTQMIAKGLDFPGVRLVGVISADTALNMPDFRAAERTFQLIAQVAGRSGRSDQVGRVVLQTFSPDDPAVTRAAKHDYLGFAQDEIATRVAMKLPPAARLTRIVLRDRDHVAVAKHARELAGHLAAANDAKQLGVRFRGPHPCPIARVADHHRLEITLTADTPGPIQKLMTELRNRGLLVSDQHTAVDVDPVSLL